MPSCWSGPIRGSRPRSLNVRIRKRWRAAPLPIGPIGERVDLTYAYDYLGAGPETLAEVVAGRQGFAEACGAPSACSSSSARARSTGPTGSRSCCRRRSLPRASAP